MADVDLRVLISPVRGGGWREFRRAALAGDHGPDLAGASFVARHSAGLQWSATAGLVAFVAVVLVVSGEFIYLWENLTWWMIGLLAMNVGLVVMLGLWSRRHTWRFRARKRFLLDLFAQVNGFAHEVEPEFARRPGEIFGYGDTRRHVDWIGVPGATGFEVAVYHVVTDTSGAEDSEQSDYWRYIAFTLRGSYPHTYVLRRHRNRRRLPKRLRDVTPISFGDTAGVRMYSTNPDFPVLQSLIHDLIAVVESAPFEPDIEVVGNELYLYAGRRFDLTSPHLWRFAFTLRERITPHLSAPRRVDGQARRHRARRATGTGLLQIEGTVS